MDHLDPPHDVIVELLQAFGDSLSGSSERHSPESDSWLDKARKFIEQHLKA